jgi:hypothetical protein
LGIGHSAQFGSTHAGVAYRSQTNPLAQVVEVAAVQPLAPTAQVCRLVLDRQLSPLVHAFVQHDAAPATPLHRPFEQGIEDDL